ncbi:BDN_1c_G0021400.mRNA.1.CDS.1 [Saccharomyces cerevisiae]|nr:BDN_1c_G0021400.mRNA.1.CDS.1 [Saccharomyces cerevisiae]CAI7153429.1 BDN_1c_G0021400.mRNA.1.CDS.1 [Saccharomyces cerevisiae]
MTDPRRRTGRHFLTPENLSSTLQITNLPPEWNQDIITSVVAGSGPVIDIKAKNDPRTGKLTGVLFDYLTSKDCKRAWEILNRIENFPVKIEQIIPPNYKDHLRETANKNSQKQVLQLNRDSYPFEAGLELPFEMVTEVPIPRRPPPPQAANNTNSVSNNTNIQFPDILSKASKHLPSFQDGSIIAPDKISQNLSKIPPLQLIEIISNLKILSNQENIQKSQLESFLDTNSDITISVTQALLEMGFIDYSVVTKVLKSQVGEAPSLLSSNNTSNSNTPVSVIRNNTPLHVPSNEVSNNPNNMPLNVAMPMPMSTPPFIPLPLQQQQPFGFAPPGPFMPPAEGPSMGQPVLANQLGQVQQQNISSTEGPSNANKANDSGTINMAKLQLLPENQQDMIKQVLTLTPAQIQSLPSDQQLMVENFRKEYII